MSWIATHTGKAVSLVSPLPHDICLEDIATHLARIPRFVGAAALGGHPISVGRHCLLVHEIVTSWAPRNATACLWALLHDAHEAYTGDITTPMQTALRWWGAGDAVKRMQSVMDEAIALHFGVDLDLLESPTVRKLVKGADLVALAIEKDDGLRPCVRPWGEDLPCVADRAPLKAMSPQHVIQAYTRAVRLELVRYGALYGKAAA